MGIRHQAVGAMVAENLGEAAKARADWRDEARGSSDGTVGVPESLWARRAAPTCWCYCCSVAHTCPTLCEPVDCSTPGFPVLPHLLEFAPTHVH